MAYPYTNPYLQNGYYGSYFAPQAQNAPQMTNSTMPIQNAPTTQNNGLIWVQGETGAKSYMVAPNTTVLLMDSEAQKFYIKSVDASGLPLPLRIFEFMEVSPETHQNAPEAPKAADMDKYITRDEFEHKLAEIAPKTAKKKSEVIGDE